MQLIELPLLDHLFTWTNKRVEPTLARLDRAFFNIGFRDGFPGATLTSGHCPTSDHTPLIASIQTNIPKPNAFKLERSWFWTPLSLPSVLPAWQSVAWSGDLAWVLVAQIKVARQTSNVWLHLWHPRSVVYGICAHNAYICTYVNGQHTGSCEGRCDA